MVNIKKLSKILGLAGGVLSIALWIMFNFYNPYSNQVEVDSVLITFFMLLLPAALAIVASIKSKSSFILCAFLWAAPFSLYLALTPGIFALFGVTCLVYLVSFLLNKVPLTNE